VREPSESEWVLAGLSSRYADYSEATSVANWEFDSSGNVTVTAYSTNGECASTSSTSAYLWTGAGPGAVEITNLDGSPLDGGRDASQARTIFRIDEVCYQPDGTQPVERIQFENGAELPSGPAGYVRGKVCLEPEGPCPAGEFCNGAGCRTVWCDGEPPEPVECDW
jgi:hypothetical protein